MNEILDLTNSIVLSNITNQELLDEIARRYNRNPAELREDISRFMYAFDAMEAAKEVSDEENNHGIERPF